MTDQTPSDLPAAAQPEWIPVPQPAPAPAQKPAASKLGIVSMCLGLVGILSAIVAAIYLLPLAALAAVAGMVAIVLGVVALFRRHRPLGPIITGIVTGIIAAFTAALIGLVSLGMLAVSAFSSAEFIDDGDGQPESSEQQEWHDDSEASLLEWPANMASGGIVFGEGMQPRESAPLKQYDVPETTPIERANGIADIRLYVDYRCPHCATFEAANGAALQTLVESGDATLELVPLTFLDRASEGTQYSSRAAAAVACVVSNQPEATWAAHTALLRTDVQPQGAGPGLTNDELIAVLDDATGGTDAAVSDCIDTEQYVPFASALSEWVFMNPVPNAVDPAQAIQGTPLVLVNGVPYLGDPADAAAFAAFLTENVSTPSN